LRAGHRFGGGNQAGNPPCVPSSAWEHSPAVRCHRLNSAGWVDRPARPARPAGEEWAYAGSSQRHSPLPPHFDAQSDGRKHTGGEDQDQLCRPGLRGLGSAAMPVAARSAVLVRPAYLSAPDPPPVRAAGRVGQLVTHGTGRVIRLRSGAAILLRAWPPGMLPMEHSVMLLARRPVTTVPSSFAGHRDIGRRLAERLLAHSAWWGDHVSGKCLSWGGRRSSMTSPVSALGRRARSPSSRSSRFMPAHRAHRDHR